ncbi:hypothetical protein PYW08_005466 [Mythimna loreyi]|uniref:Uncharacterized protein n=1 Tax=Mythimna loreyi TaxID=667449 RepID=A0ACC2QHQ4_9NEOP|nr:hypothetical protein PYW08_005466 [Mythimna loreyi]
MASPLGINVLLSMFRENSPTVEKYVQIAKTFQNTEGCKLENRVFISSSKDISKMGQFTDVEKIDFSKKDNNFMVYMKKYGDLGNHEFSNKTEFICTNICTFESRWQLNKRSGLKMTLYNSFNYTDDIRYEGRLMELPLESKDFKLVLVIPNESDVIVNALFATLTNQGLAAAINSIQPLFTAHSAFSIHMSIDVKSRVLIKEKISAVTNGTAVQYGAIAVTEEGTRVNVVTCLHSPADSIVDNADYIILKPGKIPSSPLPPFYFAVVYQDTPIFYGDFKR